ncbi:MAG: LytR/AlgR family response regulator transcription factor [Turicibacter sp.]
MIRIGLCDDDSLYLQQLETILIKVSQKENANIDIIKFSSGEQLLSFYQQHPNYFNLLFLDIVMGSINGIETAKSIRNQDTSVFIFFITSSKAYAFDSYEVKAVDYILKPLNPICIQEKFTDILTKIKTERKNMMTVKCNQDMYSFNINHVVCFESNLRKITAHTLTENITFYDKLSTLEQTLAPYHFIRCHQSYLINLSCVKNIVGTTILTTTNQEIPISKKYIKPLKEAFMTYLKSQLLQG